MKTISMPLEEYEKELNAAKASGYNNGFHKGVTEAIYQIEERLYHIGNETRGMTDSGLAKMIKDCVGRIRAKFTRPEVTIRSRSDESGAV